MSSVDCAEPLLAVGRNGPWPEASGYTISGTGLAAKAAAKVGTGAFYGDRSIRRGCGTCGSETCGSETLPILSGCPQASLRRKPLP
jgi:hypothetical protein